MKPKGSSSITFYSIDRPFAFFLSIGRHQIFDLPIPRPIFLQHPFTSSPPPRRSRRKRKICRERDILSDGSIHRSCYQGGHHQRWRHAHRIILHLVADGVEVGSRFPHEETEDGGGAVDYW